MDGRCSRRRFSLAVQFLGFAQMFRPHFALFRFGRVQWKSGRRRAQLVQVDQPESCRIARQFDDHQSVDQARRSNHFHFFGFAGNGLADEQDVREEETVNVHFGRALWIRNWQRQASSNLVE